MRRYVNRLLRSWWFHVWVIRLATRNALGRWYIFRDAPRLLVKVFCVMPDEVAEAEDDMSRLRDSAREEWHLRKMREKRK